MTSEPPISPIDAAETCTPNGAYCELPLSTKLNGQDGKIRRK
jgi:hypothetical protein